MTAQSKITAARTSLVLEQPFFGSLALSLKMKADESCDTAWVNGRELGYNPTWIDSLNHDTITAMVAHEVMHCFPPDTLLMTRAGLKRIADIQTGEYVFDKRGAFTRVIGPMSRPYTGKVITIKPACGLEFQVTTEHPILCLRMSPKKQAMGVPWRIAQMKNPARQVQFIPAGEINPKTDVLAFHVPAIYRDTEQKPRQRMIARRIRDKYQYKKIQLDPETAYILGWWVGDGGLAKPCSSSGTWFGHPKEQRIITLTLSLKDPAEKLSEIIERRFYRKTYTAQLKEKAQRIQFSSTTVSRYLRKHFTDGNGTKAIPSWMIAQPDSIIRAFIQGLLESDGTSANAHTHEIANTSLSVIGVSSLLLMRLGYLPGLTQSREESEKNLAGYKVQWNEKQDVRKDRGVQYQNVWFTQIQQFKKEHYSGTVHNIETASHTYSLPFVTVHNCAMGHPWRRDGRNSQAWNESCDKAINSELRDSGFTLPDGALYPSERGKSAEWYYARNQQEDQSGTGQGSQGQGQSKPDPLGEVRDAPTGPDGDGDPAPTEQEWKQKTAHAAQMAKMAGKLPGGMARQIAEALKPRIDVRSLLLRFFSERSNGDYSWSRPNSRYLSQGLYLPALESKALGEVAVMVDTSGSVDETSLSYARGIVESVISECNPAAVTVYYADSRIKKVVRFEQGEPLTWDPMGGGGTDFEPALTAIDADGSAVCAICITDLYGHFPDIPPSMPVLWLATSERIAPFGETIPLPV